MCVCVSVTWGQSNMKKYVWQQKTRPNSSKLPETFHPPEIFGIFLVRRTTRSTYLLLFFCGFFFGWRRLLDVSAKHCYQRIFAAAVTDGAEPRCVGLFASGSLCRRGEKTLSVHFLQQKTTTTAAARHRICVCWWSNCLSSGRLVFWRGFFSLLSFL